MENSPFMKELASSDRALRDKALTSLRTFLHSGRPFTPLDLAKLWRGLFFSMWHSDRPIPQQRLATELASLVAPLPRELFIPFLKAFWNTMAREWTSIDALRMDKFLRLVRVYVNAGFGYLQAQGWEMGLVEDYKGLIEEGPLSEDNKNSGDGLRYHVLDVWVDELDKVDPEREMGCDVDEVMAPVRKLAEKGKTSTVRKRAKESLNDERLVEWKDEDGERENGEAGGEDEEFDGFDQ